MRNHIVNILIIIFLILIGILLSSIYLYFSIYIWLLFIIIGYLVYIKLNKNNFIILGYIFGLLLPFIILLFYKNDNLWYLLIFFSNLKFLLVVLLSVSLFTIMGYLHTKNNFFSKTTLIFFLIILVLLGIPYYLYNHSSFNCNFNSDKYGCYLNKIKNDISNNNLVNSFCHNINNDDCFIILALEIEDLKFCESIQNNKKYDICISYFVVKDNNNLCEKTKFYSKDDCLNWLFSPEHRPSFFLNQYSGEFKKLLFFLQKNYFFNQ